MVYMSTRIDFDVLLSFFLLMDSTLSFDRETQNKDDVGNIKKKQAK